MILIDANLLIYAVNADSVCYGKPMILASSKALPLLLRAKGALPDTR